MRARAVTVALIAAFTMGATGCGLFQSDSPEDAAEEFLDALAVGDIERAAGLTDSPQSAEAVLDQAAEALRPESLAFEVTESVTARDSASATVSFELDWHLEHDRRWSYAATAEMYAQEDGWKVHWSPTVLHPELGAQHKIAMREDPPDLAPVLDRDGSALLRPITVVSVLLYPDEAQDGASVREVATALGDALSQFDDRISTRSIMSGVDDLDDDASFYLVAALRQPDYEKVKSDIYDLPGVKFSSRERLLPPTRDFGAQVLPGIRSVVEEQVEGLAGWRVVALDAAGSETAQLHVEDATPSEAVATTLSRRTQEAAEQAIQDVDEPAAIVAIEASSGDILAVGQNTAANAQGPIGLTGRYPPGSTFKIVTALAALSEGSVTPGADVDCPGTTTIGGRLIPNEDRFALGEATLTRAFARSCNTTFAQLAADLPDDALTEAAGMLGLGADFELSGATTVTGSVPPTDNVVERAENGFGQGKTLASPFGMALVAATASAGEMPVPRLLAGAETGVSGETDPPPADALAAVRDMMRAVVTDGTATKLASLSDVRGKTGTAQFGDGSESHGWFVGYQDDVAFAVLIVGGGSSKPAVEVAHRFLSDLG